jgi:tartrate-resistant acid phosphatase type 5
MLRLRLNILLLLVALSLSIYPVLAQGGPIIQRDETVRFAVIGDYGDNSRRQAEVAALVRRLDPAFIITTGDNNYPAGEQATIDQNIGQYYSSYIAPYFGEYGEGSLENRFFPALGNHDWQTGSAKPFTDYFTLPGNERYYEFNWGSVVRLFALDSDPHEPDGIESDSIQANWLRERLAAATEPWRIVYLHHPPFSSSEGYTTLSAQWDYTGWGANAVISGHAHVYERLMINGIPYIINGLGGGEVDGFSDAAPGSEVRFNAAHGAMLVEASANSMTYTFHGIYGRPLDSTNQQPVIDEWIELDATPVIQADGLHTFILDGTYTNDVGFSSMESGANAPQLVLQIAGSDTPLVFTTTHDATVNAGTPDTNAGTGPNLRVVRTETDHRRAYLQFEVTGITGTIEQATVRLHVTFSRPRAGGVALYAADNFFSGTNVLWLQDMITWSNAPALRIDVNPIDTFTVQR